MRSLDSLTVLDSCLGRETEDESSLQSSLTLAAEYVPPEIEQQLIQPQQHQKLLTLPDGQLEGATDQRLNESTVLFSGFGYFHLAESF